MRIGILGPLEVWTDSGAPLEVSGARLRGLLCLLALTPGQLVSQSRLIDALWAAEPPAGAANALQALVSRLRKVLPEGVVESHPRGYRLTLDQQSVDARRFENLVAAGRDALVQDPGRAAVILDDALALWRGTSVEELPPDHIADATAARLMELRLSAVEDHADAGLRLGTAPPDVGRLEALVAEHRTRERAVALLMRALCASGRTADALTVYERLRVTLADQLGTDPSPELADLHLKVLRGEIQPMRVDAAGQKPTNLRAGLTSFVGRDDDVVRVLKLVGESRLTTLTGPGGSGKTRLAVESAQGLVDQTRDGVWLVELAPLGGAGEIPQAVLTAMGLREQAVLPRAKARGADQMTWSEHLDQLARYLESGADLVDRLSTALDGKQVLLVLDNCEHLVDPVAALVEYLLGECQGLRVVATSREPLGITGETLWPVEPLALPPSEADAGQAASYAAVRLFTDRATAAYPDFTVDDRTATSVVRICRALDGIPLAIELAAARLRTMTPEQVADRLDDRFQLLAAGSRTALHRHKTLRAVVNWSWELLDDAERRLLRRLAFFWSGATADAAARIVADDSRGEDVFDTLTALVDKSLLILDRNGRPRYRMLETVKAYGLERLDEAGETERVRQAHADYFLELAEAAEPHLRGSGQLDWLRLLDDDRENLHAALRGAIGAGDAATAVRLAAALGWYWNIRAMRGEGIELTQEALALPGEAPDAARALAYAHGGMCGVYGLLGQDQAMEWLRTAADLAGGADATHPILRLVGPMRAVAESWFAGEAWVVPGHVVNDPDPWVRGFGLVMRAYAAFFAGRDHQQAEADLNAALTATRGTGDRAGISMALSGAVEIESWRGDLAMAASHAEEALRLVSELGSVEDMAMFHAQLARLHWLLGDRERSRAELEAADQNADRTGLGEVYLTVRTIGAELTRLTGDTASARARLEQVTRFNAEPGASSDGSARLASQYGYVEAAAGDLATARAWHASALETAASSCDAMTMGPVLVGIADLALVEGRADRAAELLGASVAVRGMADRSSADADRVAAAARAALGESSFTEAYERGRATADMAAAGELAKLTLGA